MSGRHICICGKKRGHNPITITVTQCPKNYEIKTTGLNSLPECDTSPPKKELSPPENHASEPTESKNIEKSTTTTKTPVEGHIEKETVQKMEDSSEKPQDKNAQSPRKKSVSESDELKNDKKIDSNAESHNEKQPENIPDDKIENVSDNEVKGPENSDNTGSLEKPEGLENLEKSEDPENSKKSEGPENSKRSEGSESPEKNQASESSEKSEDQTKETPQEEHISQPTEQEASQQQVTGQVQVDDHQNEPELNEKSSHQVEDAAVEGEAQNAADDVVTEPDKKDVIPEDVREKELIEDSDFHSESVSAIPSPSKIGRKDDEDQTVMYMTDVSLNTIPFLDNLFMAIPKTTAKSSSDYYQCKQCMLEIFVFGRHSKNCKYSFLDQNLLNCLSDGNTILEAVGKLSFPVKRNGIEDDSFSVYSQLNSNILKEKTISKNELATIYASTFRKLEAHIKKDRLVEMMKHRNQADYPKTEQIDFNRNSTDKAIQLDYSSSVHRLNDFCVQFTSIPTPSITRSIQFDQDYHKTQSKWYDIFLMCFGMKANEHCNIDEEILADRIHGISSIEISKYLKI